MIQPMNTANPLNGTNYVAISMPNISIKPGPTIVIMPLSFTPNSKNKSAKFHF